MKKVLLSIIFAMMMGFCANAQIDNIITDWDDSRSTMLDEMPWLPAVNVGSIYNDYPAHDTPLGDGLLVFTALGAGYIVARKKRKKFKL